MKEKPKEYHASVISNDLVSPKVFRLHLDLGASLEFKAGQYLMMYLPEAEFKNPRFSGHQESDLHKPRAYSIASPPSWKTHLEFLIELKEGGVLTPYLNALKAGNSLKVKGPLGKFTVKNVKEEVSFIATGTGIAPFRSMVHDLLEKNPQQKINLLYGFRYPEEFLLKDEWDALASKYQNINIVATCSKPDNDWHGLTGRVTQYISQLSPENNDVYLCGSEGMIKDAKDLLRGSGFLEDRIHIELW